MIDDPPPRPVPTLPELFLTYGKIGLIGFGGINAWARRVLVEEKRWLTDQEYAETLGLGQVLPGPNALNAAIMIGDRFHGTAGAIAAPGAMFGGPLILLAGLAMFYDAYGDVPTVRAVLAGVAAAAAGMVLGTAAKMTQKLRPPPLLLAVGLLALASSGIFRVPLPWTVLGLAPFGIAAAWWVLRAR
jgi:chromate transporter